MFIFIIKPGESEEYNECHEEFKHGEFPFGLFGSIVLVVHLPTVSVTNTN